MMKRLKPLNTRKAWMISGLLVMSSVAFAGMAQAQGDVTNRLNRIENEINTLNRAVYKGQSPSSVSTGGAQQANAEVRMQQLERELRDLRGMIEEQSHSVRQMQDKLDRSLSDMELRMGDIEKSGSNRQASAAPAPKTWVSQASKAPSSVQPASGHPSDGKLGTMRKSPESGAFSKSSSDQAASVYENAFAMLKSGQYDAAESGFQKFISQYPGHVLTGNAKYWLGETFYVRGQYERAARLFAEGYKQYPKGSKAPDNLLKLGMSLNGLGNTQDACVAFGQLQQEFSGKSQPVLRRAQQEMSRIGCT